MGTEDHILSNFMFSLNVCVLCFAGCVFILDFFYKASPKEKERAPTLANPAKSKTKIQESLTKYNQKIEP